MPKLEAFLFLCLLVSCSNPKFIPHFTASKPPELTGDQKIAYLTAEAEKRHLHWRVFCVWWVDDQHFEGVAWPESSDDVRTVNRWMEVGKTQADAAYALYRSIQGAPTHPAEKSKDVMQRPIDCPPDISWQQFP